MTVSWVDDDGLREVCRAWFGSREAIVRPLVGDGFSGAMLARVSPGDGAADVVLKSFPAASRPRVEWVHGFMRHLRSSGCLEIPDVIATRVGGTVADDGSGRIWEAVQFVEGVAEDAPDPSRARAAASTLARVHAAACAWPAASPTHDIAPAMTRRIEHAGRLLADPWRMPAHPPRSAGDLATEVASRLERAIVIAHEAGGPAALRRVAATKARPLPVQAVLRDVWSGHVIFAADATQVAGIIDLHAAAIDTPATDLARLLGSWRRDPTVPPSVAWCDALAAYEAIRPLADVERRLVPWLEATGTGLGLDNWFRWVMVEGRRFERPARVVARVDRLLAHLRGALEWLDGSGAGV